jgi:hypothetical protein
MLPGEGQDYQPTGQPHRPQTHADITDTRSPLSHAALISHYLHDQWPASDTTS